MNKDREFILGLAGFIKWSINNHKEDGWILSNLAHDIFHQINDEIGFSSRTKSYAKYLNEATV